MLAAGIVFGILLLLLLMAGMWLAFNMNDYGVNDWVDDEEDTVAERRSRESRLEEVDHQTMDLERRRRGGEVLEERGKVRGREEVYCISKHSPSVSLDSAISVGSPLDSTGGSLHLNNSLAGLHCADLLSSKDRVVLASVHLSPGGGGEDRRGLDAGSQQWSRNSRHRMVDRWVDQVQQAVGTGQVANWWQEVGKRQLELEGMSAREVEEFWQSVTWFWGSEATEEERLVNVERLAKMEVDGARQVANAKVDKMIEAKTRSMEQQAMLQEKVAEKLWDLRRARVREGGGAAKCKTLLASKIQ